MTERGSAKKDEKECRSERKSLLETDPRENSLLVVSAGVSILMMAAVVYVPALQIIFKTVPLSLMQLSVVLGFTLIGPLSGAAALTLRKPKKAA